MGVPAPGKDEEELSLQPVSQPWELFSTVSSQPKSVIQHGAPLLTSSDFYQWSWACSEKFQMHRQDFPLTRAAAPSGMFHWTEADGVAFHPFPRMLRFLQTLLTSGSYVFQKRWYACQSNSEDDCNDESAHSSTQLCHWFSHSHLWTK